MTTFSKYPKDRYHEHERIKTETTDLIQLYYSRRQSLENTMIGAVPQHLSLGDGKDAMTSGKQYKTNAKHHADLSTISRMPIHRQVGYRLLVH